MLGVVLIVLGVGWFALMFAVFVSVFIDPDPEGSMAVTFGAGLTVFLLGAVGLLLATAGYALLRARRQTWLATGRVAGVGFGLGWFACMGAAAVVSGQFVWLLLAFLGLLPAASAGYARLRPRRPGSDQAPSWPGAQTRQEEWSFLWLFLAYAAVMWSIVGLLVSLLEPGVSAVNAALFIGGLVLLLALVFVSGLLWNSPRMKEGRGRLLRAGVATVVALLVTLELGLGSCS